MTIERKQDQDEEATVQMPRPVPVSPEISPELEDVDPEQTLVREDWESTVIRKVAPHVAAVADDVDSEDFGWESEGLRRLSREVANAGAASKS